MHKVSWYKLRLELYKNCIWCYKKRFSELLTLTNKIFGRFDFWTNPEQLNISVSENCGDICKAH